MGDRDDLCPLRQAPQRLADGVRSLAADAGVDLVEDERLAATDRRDGERDPRELAAGSGLGHRHEGQSAVGADQERDLVRAGRARFGLPPLDPELAVAKADPAELLGDRGRERLRGALPSSG